MTEVLARTLILAVGPAGLSCSSAGHNTPGGAAIGGGTLITHSAARGFHLLPGKTGRGPGAISPGALYLPPAFAAS
jgi:hypothetical protein